jgi:hypothetical protein
MRKTLLLATVFAASLTGAASAANLVTNGSFESGLTGWTIGGTTGGGFPPVAIFYGSASGYPTGAFGEAVPQNDAPTNSPDEVGARAAYFVDDLATNQSLSQLVALTPGIYQIGFSAYAPANGFANFYDATFKGLVASVELANYAVSAGPVTTWQTFAGAANIGIAGNYLVEFVFNTAGVPAKDVVIDQVYIIEGNPPIGVPEPTTLALFGAGLIGLGLARRRAARPAA